MTQTNPTNDHNGDTLVCFSTQPIKAPNLGKQNKLINTF